MADRTRLIVRKTLEQLRGELAEANREPHMDSLETLNAFEKRLDFNLDLAGIPKVTGRKPKAKPPKAE